MDVSVSVRLGGDSEGTGSRLPLGKSLLLFSVLERRGGGLVSDGTELVFVDDAVLTFGDACLLTETLVTTLTLLADALMVVVVTVVFPRSDGRVMGWENVPRAHIGALVSAATLETPVLTGPA